MGFGFSAKEIRAGTLSNIYVAQRQVGSHHVKNLTAKIGSIQRWLLSQGGDLWNVKKLDVKSVTALGEFVKSNRQFSNPLVN